MKRKSFTLVEILVGLIIISILASLSIAAYRKTVETNNESMCRENLKTLWKAIDIYTMENDTLPATLAQLTPRQIYLAHSQAAGETKENHFIAAIRNILGTKPALAQSLARYYAGNRNIFRCPNDTAAAPPAAGGCSSPYQQTSLCGSYYFVFTSDNVTWDSTTDTYKLRKESTVTTPLVYDSSSRHQPSGAAYTLGITPGGVVGKVVNGNVVP